MRIVNQPVVHLIDHPSTGAKRFLNISASKNGDRARLVIKKGLASWREEAFFFLFFLLSAFSQGDATTPAYSGLAAPRFPPIREFILSETERKEEEEKERESPFEFDRISLIILDSNLRNESFDKI